MQMLGSERFPAATIPTASMGRFEGFPSNFSMLASFG
jgi:hypothetical protein